MPIRRALRPAAPAVLALAAGLAGGAVAAHRAARPAAPPRPEVVAGPGERAEGMLAAAQEALEAGRFSDALAGAERFRREFSRSWKAPQAARVEAAALAGLGRHEEALLAAPGDGPPEAARAWIALARAVRSGEPGAFARVAEDLLSRNDPVLAEALFRAATDSLGEERVPPEVDLAWSRVLRDQRRTDEQLAAYDRVLAHHPDHPIAERIRFGRARLLHLEFGDTKGAEEAYLDFLAHHPDSPHSRQCLLWLGELRVAAGDPAGAETYFRRVALDEASPRDKVWCFALLALSSSRERRGGKADAEAILAAALDGEAAPLPENGDEALARLARLRADIGDREGEIQTLSRLVAAFPRSSRAGEASRRLAEIRAQDGR
ncbi:MAG: tetratricopeptide repeat protein [Planctomycetes bacterium]|nr:tetratricopeptide repeat protein [Planctomycetota bacterium]